jgi:high-affinity Fe2+/Pb2+ permease
MFFEGAGEVANSPFIVPVAGCLMIVGIVAFQAWGSVRRREVQSQERLAAIAKGLPIPPTPEELAIMHGKPTSDAKRRYGSVRLAGIILTAGSVGVALFFILLTIILHQREILSGVACALVPAGIGVGLLIDANLQRKEMDAASTAGSSNAELTRSGLGL